MASRIAEGFNDTALIMVNEFAAPPSRPSFCTLYVMTVVLDWPFSGSLNSEVTHFLFPSKCPGGEKL